MLRNKNGVPGVVVTLDRERFVCFPLPAIFAIEDETGVSLIASSSEEQKKLFQPDSKREQFQNTATLLWAGLRDEDPSITLEQVLSMLHFGNLDAAITAIGDALAALREEKADEDPTVAGADPAVSS